MNSYIDILNEGLKTWNIYLDNKQLAMFDIYLQQIGYWNQRLNLTAIEDDKEIVIKHFLDSISSALVTQYSGQEVADIGTGAGFPGLPLKIVFPHLKMNFIDSSAKKSKALREICGNVNISDYKILNDNIEKIGNAPQHREKFDLVVSRALAKMNTLLEYGIPLLKTNGMIIIYKGPNIKEEVDNSCTALEKLNSKIIKNVEIILPFSDFRRTILVVEKLGKTASIYPRKVGMPKKNPI